MTVYAQHVRHSDKRKVRHSKKLLDFVAAQNARLAVAAVKAAGTLTLGANPGDGKTVVIGSKTYTFQTSLTEADGHVLIGADATASATNLFHAINKSGGTAGTDYANATVADADFVATNPSAGVVVVTAKVAGVRSDATTTNATTCSWGAATVTGGVNAAPFDALASLKRNSAAQIAAAAAASDLN